MSITALNLEDRKLLAISGKDKKDFLQGLITNDISLVGKNNSIFTAFLTPQGKFLADFFIYHYQDKFIIDIHQKFYQNFLQKLKIYKLKAEIVIDEIKGSILLCQDQGLINQKFKEIKEGNTIAMEEKILTIDNRNKILGVRIILFNNDMSDFAITENSLAQYHILRIKHKIIDGAYDLIPEKSIILEYGYQDISAINFDKGCYLGQELMTRTHRRGVIRKKIYNIIIYDITETIPQNAEIIYDDRKIGSFCFGYQKGQNIYGLGLFKIEESEILLSKKIDVIIKINEVILKRSLAISFD